MVMEQPQAVQHPRLFEDVLHAFSLAGKYDINDVIHINAEAEKYTRNVVKKL